MPISASSGSLGGSGGARRRPGTGMTARATGWIAGPLPASALLEALSSTPGHSSLDPTSCTAPANEDSSGMGSWRLLPRARSWESVAADCSRWRATAEVSASAMASAACAAAASRRAPALASAASRALASTAADVSALAFAVSAAAVGASVAVASATPAPPSPPPDELRRLCLAGATNCFEGGRMPPVRAAAVRGCNAPGGPPGLPAPVRFPPLVPWLQRLRPDAGTGVAPTVARTPAAGPLAVGRAEGAAPRSPALTHCRALDPAATRGCAAAASTDGAAPARRGRAALPAGGAAPPAAACARHWD
jgi:hypothetical protein